MPDLSTPSLRRFSLVVMGVSGCGKSTVGRLVAEATGASFIEGDAYHPPENITKMRSGTPLDDADRAGWLEALSRRLAGAAATGESVVLACSALKRRYRDVLRKGEPGLLLLHLDAPAALVASRLAARSGHFMPPSLLESQCRDLEAPGADEACLRGDITQPPDALGRAAVEWLRALRSPSLPP